MSATAQAMVSITELDPEKIFLFGLSQNGKELLNVKEVIPGDTGSNKVVVVLANGDTVENLFSAQVNNQGKLDLKFYGQFDEYNMFSKETSFEEMLKSKGFSFMMIAHLAARYPDQLSFLEDDCLESMEGYTPDQWELHSKIKNHGLVKITGFENGQMVAGETTCQLFFDIKSRLVMIMVKGTNYAVMFKPDEGTDLDKKLQKLEESLEAGEVVDPPAPKQPEPEKQEQEPSKEAAQGEQAEEVEVAATTTTLQVEGFYEGVERHNDETGQREYPKLTPEKGKPNWISEDRKRRPRFAYGLDQDGKIPDLNTKYVVDADGKVARYVEKQPMPAKVAIGLFILGLIIAGFGGLALYIKKKAAAAAAATEQTQKSDEDQEPDKKEDKQDKATITELKLRGQKCTVSHNGINVSIILRAKVSGVDSIDDTHLIFKPTWAKADTVTITKAEKDHHGGQDYLVLHVDVPKSLKQKYEEHHFLYHFEHLVE